MIVLPALCFLGAYGIQKRKRWAWYAGWIFGFFAAGAVCSCALPFLVYAETIFSVVVTIVFTVGGMCVWTFWAIWWATHREEFLRKHAART